MWEKCSVSTWCPKCRVTCLSMTLTLPCANQLDGRTNADCSNRYFYIKGGKSDDAESGQTNRALTPTASKRKATTKRKAPKSTASKPEAAGHLLPENEILGVQTALPHAKTPTPSKPKVPASSALPTIPAPLKPSSAKPTPKSRSAHTTPRIVRVPPGILGIELRELNDGRVVVWRVHSCSPLSRYISRGDILVAINDDQVGPHKIADVGRILATRGDTYMFLSFLSFRGF